MSAATADDGRSAGAAGESAGSSRGGAERIGWIALAVYVLVLLAASWQRWGDPVSDVGLDLTIAAHWTDGLVPYRDVRYWYGPLGIGTLTAAFSIFGASLWTAVAVGGVVTAGITELSRRIARRWLDPLPALGVAAMVLSIAFSGSLFDFVLPHTFAATTGLLSLLAAILLLTHGRYGWAGVAIGFTALARPEFLGFGIAALGGAALGEVRERGFTAGLLGGLKAFAFAALVAAPPYAWLASLAGVHRLFLENIWPVEFLKAVGGTFEHDQHPFDLPSFGTLLVRGTVMVGGAWIALRLLALVLPPRGGADQDTDAETTPPAPTSVNADAGADADADADAGAGPQAGAGQATGGTAGSSGAGPLPANWWLDTPRVLAVLAGALVLGFALAVVGGDAGEPARLVKADLTRALIAMTPLAAIGLGALAWAALAWLRDEPPPLQEPDDAGPGWVAAGALLATAGACGLRSYGIFSTDVYASYYAPPVVVVAAILLVRLARRTGARPALASAVVLAAGALTLSAHAIGGLYRDKSVTVHAPVGTFKAAQDGGAAVRGVIDQLVPRVQPGEPLLTMPQEPGFLFLTRTVPALYNATFLPGTLATPAEDEAAARRLIDGSVHGPVPGYEPPRYVVEGVWNFQQWGFHAQGVDVNVRLHQAVTDHYRVIARYGDTLHIPKPFTLGHAFVVYERK